MRPALQCRRSRGENAFLDGCLAGHLGLVGASSISTGSVAGLGSPPPTRQPSRLDPLGLPKGPKSAAEPQTGPFLRDSRLGGLGCLTTQSPAPARAPARPGPVQQLTALHCRVEKWGAY